MSTQTKQTQTGCKHCGATDVPASGPRGYCSNTCYHKEQGSNLLSELQADHRFCASCATQLKNVRDAKPSDPDCFIGYQFLSGDTLKGQKHVTLPGVQTQTERLIDSHGTICANCGSTNHKDTYLRDEGMLDEDLNTVAERLFDALALFRREGKHEYRFDVKAFVAAWNREQDWAYALGKSLVQE